eukprot:3054968-Pleurochrysis_carterae.AAC.1
MAVPNSDAMVRRARESKRALSCCARARTQRSPDSPTPLFRTFPYRDEVSCPILSRGAHVEVLKVEGVHPAPAVGRRSPAAISCACRLLRRRRARRQPLKHAKRLRPKCAVPFTEQDPSFSVSRAATATAPLLAHLPLNHLRRSLHVKVKAQQLLPHASPQE